MSKPRESKTARQQNKVHKSDKKFLWKLIIPIIAAVIAAVGFIIVAFINRSTAFIAIQATQTAEAFSTSIAKTAQAQLLLNTSTPSPTPIPTKAPVSFTIKVYSSSYPFLNTFIRVEKGETIEITIADQNQKWNCGRTDSVGPDGYTSEAGYADLVDPQAKSCALIGSISSDSPKIYFSVGSHIIYQASDSGTLYLGCNDSVGRFGDNPTDSFLEVNVTVLN